MNADFDVFQIEDCLTKVESDLNAHCDSSAFDENDLSILNDLLSSNDNQKFQLLHCHTNISTYKFCRGLIKKIS